MNFIEKLWNKEATLWTNKDEAKWLGWLDIVERQLKRLDEFKKIQNQFKEFSHVALLGMGGSSLCPDVLSKTFKSALGFPELLILDSTNPDQIRNFERKLNLEKTCFIVSSKSGSTLEPNIFLAYFYDVMKKKVGGAVGHHFIAITDPGSNMEKRAKELNFREIFYGDPSIGGRYSALSDFGIIPALAIGVDIEKFLNRTSLMVKACSPETPQEANPGYILGKSLGDWALKGCDKISLIASKEFSELPAWIEQLLAESTGKNGKGLIPVVESEIDNSQAYNTDRHFVYCGTKPDTEVKDKLTKLAQDGHLVTILPIEDKYDLGQEFFRWEVATAFAGYILKINPFDQPDVEASKIETRQLTDQFEKNGDLPVQKPFFETKDVALFSDEKNIKELGKVKDLTSILSAHFSRLKKNDYAALLGFIEMNRENENILFQMKENIQEKTKTATVTGFGPRFLHSTGQAYKGGPNSGVFLQITTGYINDLKIPGHKYTFGVVQGAQARGDFEVLIKRGRRALRVHLKNGSALQLVKKSLEEALNARMNK